jgi:hypothetical protein
MSAIEAMVTEPAKPGKVRDKALSRIEPLLSRQAVAVN